MAELSPNVLDAREAEHGSSAVTIRPSPAMRFGIGALLLFVAIVFFGLGVIIAVAAFQQGDNWILLFAPGSILVLALSIYMALLILPLFTRIDIEPSGVRLRTAQWRGAVPLPPLKTEFLPFEQIASVDRADEVYRPLGMTSIQTVWSLVSRDGRKLELGRTSPQASANVDYPRAAATIAQRAGLAVTDRGAFRMGGLVGAFRRGGAPLKAAPMSPAEQQASYGKAARAIQIAAAFVAAALAIRACTGGGVD